MRSEQLSTELAALREREEKDAEARENEARALHAAYAEKIVAMREREE